MKTLIIEQKATDGGIKIILMMENRLANCVKIVKSIGHLLKCLHCFERKKIKRNQKQEDVQASTLTYFSTCPFGQLTKKSTCPTHSFSCPKKLIKITKTRE
jgi:hypothetical protein